MHDRGGRIYQGGVCMGKNLVQKILESHLVDGKYEPGREIGVKIDQTLTQDATGTMAYLQFEAMHVPRVRTELSVNYVDHNVLQMGSENADDHKYLQTVTSKYGVIFSRAGNGICHQVHLERFSRPSKTLLGSDSHTPTCGGIGMIAIGAGGLDVAVAMAGGPFYLTCPRVIRINLTGKLKSWVSEKDVALKILEIFTTKGNVDYVFEYGGKGVETLSVPERATITNMGAECGVTTSIFPSDYVTREFLRAQGREKDWIELKADGNAEYEREVDLDLGSIVPLAAYPHSPGNIKTVKELEGIEVNQVCVGSCTNSSFKDLMTIARILKGKKVHPNVSFVVAPGSRQVLENIAIEGALTDIISSGARLVESACGFCIGNGQSPQTDAVSIRTNNRNFLGRSGTKSAQVYLISPETAAAAVISGKITDPRDLDKMGISYPQIEIPEKFYIDDSMLIFPSEHPENIIIFRGPNIGAPPASKPMPDAIDGEVTIKVGDNVTTDDIIPAGDKMKYRSNIPKYSQFVFEPLDPTFYDRAIKIRDAGQHNIIVSGLSYGQGSSREHAAICPMYLGVKVVIAKTLERIHASNLVNFGVIPLTFKKDSDYDDTELGDKLNIPDMRNIVKEGRGLIVKNRTKNKEFEVCYNLSEREREILLVGGALEYVKTHSY
jgi:aconitate hydratase